MKILALILVLFANSVFAQTKAVRVNLPKGKSQLTLDGTLKGKNENVYLVRGKAGKTMRLRLIVRDGEYASLQVKSPSGKVAPSSDGTDAGEIWENTLAESGDYRIIVFPPDTADKSDPARFKLEIRIE